MQIKRERISKLIPVVLAAVMLIGGQSLFAQVRIVGAIAGSVHDPTGAVVPGAKVTLKDEGTGVERQTTATAEGTFLFPDVTHGLFEVSVTAGGFQKSIIPHVQVIASQTTDVPVDLRVGQMTESVTVEGGVTPVLELTSSIVNATQSEKIVNELPTGGRDGMTFARLVPGAAGDRINNVVGAAMNVTVDGINDASNGWKSGLGFYATIPVRLGALEEVTVESGGLGADSGAESGVNIKFITKRGSSSYHGSFFYQPQSEQFNANSWTNNANGNPRSKSRTHQLGGNIGGKLVPVGYLKDKLFFFLNWEDDWNPSSQAVNTSIMTPEAQAGNYTYLKLGSTSEYNTVNVMTIAQQFAPQFAKQGLKFSTAIDPIAKYYMEMNARVQQYGVRQFETDPNVDTYRWNYKKSTNAYYPAARIDYYLTPKHQLSVAWNLVHSWDPGSQLYPGDNARWYNPYLTSWFIWSAGVQSTLTPTMFNEFRYGTQHSGDSRNRAGDLYGSYNVSPSCTGCPKANVPLRIGWGLPFSGTPDYRDAANVTGAHFITTIYDTLTRMQGQHTIRSGFTFRSTDWNDRDEMYMNPSYSLGSPSGDPINGTMFTTATVPYMNASSLPGSLGSLYNQLVGRVASTYWFTTVDQKSKQYGAPIRYNWTHSNMGGPWFQDSWRVNTMLTVNYGLRWEIQGRMYDVLGMSATPTMADIYGPSTALFTPGAYSGNFDPTGKIGVDAYKTDYKNFAPNVGIAWNPRDVGGLIGKALGGSKTVFRASWGINYFDEGTLMYSGTYACGPGVGIGCNVGKNASQSIQAGSTPYLPQFTTLTDVVNAPVPGPAAFTGIAPYNAVLHQNQYTFQSSWAGMNPNIVAPYVIQWNLGVQRELAKGSVLEVRYVGNQTHHAWRTVDLNETNIFENGFLGEFNKAQKNLAIANGMTVAQMQALPYTYPLTTLKSNNFANQGLPGQVDLPIMAAAFGARGTVPAIAATSGFNSATFAGYLQNGAAGNFASSLAGQNYFCRMMGNSFKPCLNPGIAPTGQSYDAAGAGYPINFFRLNPYTTTMNFVDATSWANYNGLQVQLRQSLSHGVTGAFNYTWSHAMANTNGQGSNNQFNWATLRNPKLSVRPSSFDQRHVISAYESYALPIGTGRKVNIRNKWLNMLIGGWNLSNTVTFSTGTPVQLGGSTGTYNTFAPSGVILAPDVSLKQISDAFHGQPLMKYNGRDTSSGADPRLNRASAYDYQRIAIPLDLIAPDGKANPKYIYFNNVAGDMGAILFIYGKNSFGWNSAMTKTFQLTERFRFSVYADANNILNHPSWGMGSTSVSSTGFGTVGAPGGNRTMTFRGKVDF